MRHEAIIIKKMPLREDDELIMCYTRLEGKQRYRAKSSTLAHSKQGTHLDILNHIEFSLVEGRQSPIVASAISRAVFPNIKKSLPALSSAHVLLECFDRIVFEGQEDERLWRFLIDELNSYENNAKRGDCDWRQVAEQSYRRFLSVLGHPENADLQELAQRRFLSLQFFQSMVQ